MRARTPLKRLMTLTGLAAFVTVVLFLVSMSASPKGRDATAALAFVALIATVGFAWSLIGALPPAHRVPDRRLLSTPPSSRGRGAVTAARNPAGRVTAVRTIVASPW